MLNIQMGPAKTLWGPTVTLNSYALMKKLFTRFYNKLANFN